MYKWSFLLLLTAGMIGCNSSQETVSNTKENSEVKVLSPGSITVSQDNLKKDLEFLASDDLKGRATGSEGIDKAATYIEEVFKENNIKPYFDTYRDPYDAQGKPAFNVIGFLEGSDPQLKKEFVIIGAHYDHLGIITAKDGDSIANGANDDGAGTVAVLELARQFAKIKDNKRSILFTLYSGEEMGLLGSKDLAQRLKDSGVDLYAMFNLEMIGVPMQGQNYLAYLTGFENSNMAEKFNEYSKAEILGFLPKAGEYNLFKRSDNYSFYQVFKVPAQTISTFDFTNYDYYHQVDDEVDKMDFTHMAKIVKSVIPGLYQMVNTTEKEIKMN